MKFDTLLRFAFIETRLFWEDGLKAGDLVAVFDLTRQTAQAVIENYRHRYPGQMRYDASKKRQVATEDFEPHHISMRTLDFLDFLRGDNLRKHYLDEQCDWSELAVYDVDCLLRPAVLRSVIQPILAALRHQQTLYIEYRSKYNNPIRCRVISPNHLVFADERYHLLAYCHTLNQYLDFVLSRIIWVETADEDWVSAEQSDKWKDSTLRFQPNPKLPKEVQATLLRGYSNGEQDFWEINCKQDAEHYICRKLERLKDEDNETPLWVKISP
ncbi:WYL domain-containing protein [Candidatus Venteria ishoeyi]|uniref:Uncharacterized protein n=1 Tax=Candidatus Venteria ishoeyi TaxID=1899563 RepID=A0A1H6FDQ6_9GAMM|nr:WYL domain-containing protein [Candidatus Venteria ishoeyi]SEH07165.1 Uncharacterised protein [Candidatus Venteria ishoeyi]